MTNQDSPVISSLKASQITSAAPERAYQIATKDSYIFDISDILKKTFSSLKEKGVLSTSRTISLFLYNFLQTKFIFNSKNIEDRFTKIYKLNYWGERESVSGSGSSIIYTANLRKNLPNLFTQYSITSIFDAPCGDFNWMQHVLKDYPLDYIGADIVLPLIKSNKKQHENGRTNFVHMDLTKGTFPKVDLMFCRDCLFHLSYEDIKLVLENFVNSQTKYLLTTTHVNNNLFLNKNITTGDFRFIDLFSSPFNFSNDVKYRIEDWQPPAPAREMCLWSREQVIEAIRLFEI